MTEKKLKILIVHNYYKLPGGEGNVVKDEKNMLEEAGHNVFLYTRDNKEIDDFNIFRKIMLPLNYLFNIRTFFEVKKIIKTNDIDIIHVHNTINIISKSVYYAAIKCKKPIVQTVHNFRFLCPAGTFFHDGKICEDCLTNNLFYAIRRKCYRNSFLETLLSTINMKLMRSSNLLNKINFICLTDNNKNKLLEINNKSNKKLIDINQIYVKPNFVFNSLNNINKERENYFVYASRIETEKGIKFLLETWKNIKDTELVVCGTGKDEEWCKNYVKNNNMTNIHLRGNVNHEELMNLISKSKCLIFPSILNESFGLSVIEAYSTGTPVIAPNFGNLANLVIDNATGYRYSVNDKEDFIRVYNKILNSNLYESSFAEYKAKYTKEENYKQLLSIYNECIKKANIK